MRYSIYFTPPADDPLTVLAAKWLGRDAFRDLTIEQFDVDGFAADELSELTAEPRRYGFHATLKAPMELAADRSEGELLSALDAFASDTQSFEIPKIALGQLGPFFALVPHETYDPLQTYAAACVRDFEPFRAPLSDADIARRKPERLSESERANLMDWGYPYVFDDFHFHMTLTGQVPPERQAEMRAALEPVFADHVYRPLAISHVSLFIEAERGAPFVMKRILPLRP
jgi:putative phosphonate metabolism protein